MTSDDEYARLSRPVGNCRYFYPYFCPRLRTPSNLCTDVHTRGTASNALVAVGRLLSFLLSSSIYTTSYLFTFRARSCTICVPWVLLSAGNFVRSARINCAGIDPGWLDPYHRSLLFSSFFPLSFFLWRLCTVEVWKRHRELQPAHYRASLPDYDGVGNESWCTTGAFRFSVRGNFRRNRRSGF